MGTVMADEGVSATPERRVLIVDDEAPIRTALRRYFTRRGWAVAEAGDVEEAADLVRAEPRAEFDAVICDLTMPGQSGVELHDLLERERPELHRRLILTTGDASSPEATALRARTSRPVVQKPFEFSELAALLDTL